MAEPLEIGNDDVGPFDEDQAKALVMATLKGAGGSATEAEVKRVFDWARQVAIDASFLDLLLDGAIFISWDEDTQDFMFQKNPEFDEALLNA